MKLTPTAIKNLTLPPGIDDKIFFDDDLPGFGLRLRRSGDRSWWAQYAIGGRTRKLRLGSVAELDIGKARAAAKTVLARSVLAVIPPARRPAHGCAPAKRSACCCAPSCSTSRPACKPRSLKETDRHLFKQCRPLHGIPIAALNRRTVAARLAAIAQTQRTGRRQSGARLVGRVLHLGD